MTQDEFKAEIRRLTGLRFQPASFLGHWEAIDGQRVPLGVLRAAVTRCLTTRVDFPAPAELLQDCDQVKHLATLSQPEADRTTPLSEPVTFEHPHGTITVTGEHSYHCEVCSDLGWSSHWCGGDNHRMPWLDLYRCERQWAHAEHDWTRKCRCYEINPVLVRKRERQASYAGGRG